MVILKKIKFTLLFNILYKNCKNTFSTIDILDNTAVFKNVLNNKQTVLKLYANITQFYARKLITPRIKVMPTYSNEI